MRVYIAERVMVTARVALGRTLRKGDVATQRALPMEVQQVQVRENPARKIATWNSLCVGQSCRCECCGSCHKPPSEIVSVTSLRFRLLVSLLLLLLLLCVCVCTRACVARCGCGARDTGGPDG